MELFLNLLWLSIALAALGAFARVTRRQHSSPTRRHQAWIALTCVLVLLFFAISMTDDLHQDGAFIEEAWSSKRHSAAVQAGTLEHGWHASIHPVKAIPTASDVLGGTPLRFVALLSPSIADRIPSQLTFVAVGRAPPRPLL